MPTLEEKLLELDLNELIGNINACIVVFKQLMITDIIVDNVQSIENYAEKRDNIVDSNDKEVLDALLVMIQKTFELLTNVVIISANLLRNINSSTLILTLTSDDFNAINALKIEINDVNDLCECFNDESATSP